MTPTSAHRQRAREMAARLQAVVEETRLEAPWSAIEGVWISQIAQALADAEARGAAVFMTDLLEIEQDCLECAREAVVDAGEKRAWKAVATQIRAIRQRGEGRHEQAP